MEKVLFAKKKKMTPRISFSSLVLAFLLLVASANAAGISARFSYSGSTGPDKWGSLSSDYKTCDSGKAQSPIDIKKDDVKESDKYEPLNREYESAKATLINHHFGLSTNHPNKCINYCNRIVEVYAKSEVRYDGDCGGMTVGGKNYTLKQFHWHYPSEHLIDGKQYDAELHVVHMAEDGSISVVAILFEYGDSDPFVSKLRKGLEKMEKDKCKEDEESHIDLGNMSNKLLKKKSDKYYRYVGSLTTPPCAENVTWTVLSKVRKISEEQVKSLKAPLDEDCQNNSRPVQPLNGRTVELYSKS